ncbi:MAG: class I SAM-dependent methyltransferase [Rhodospirillales bacterium]|jgi:cyclopropane-fatty-acyl-phospholipid synthase
MTSRTNYSATKASEVFGLRGLTLPRSLVKSALRRLVGSVERGSLTFVFNGGDELHIAGAHSGPNAVINIHRSRAVTRLMMDGYLGFSEGYLAADWTSPSLPHLFDFGTANMGPLDQRLTGSNLSRILHKAVHFLRSNSRLGSKRNIANHYDLGNRFFREWLDPSMAYSAALFENDEESLTQAQFNKFQRIIRELNIEPGHHVLEIGGGWGGLAMFIARETGARVTAITISKEQFVYARERVLAEGLESQVDIQLCDYRDLDGTYDRIVSIEMLEAVGERYWATYFDVVAHRLVSGGAAILQVITVADERFDFYRNSVDFIQKYVFPGGMLLSPGIIRRHAEAAGLRYDNVLFFGESYGRTLDNWFGAFQEHWPEIELQGFDARFKRLWEYYLTYTAAGFRAGSIDVGQFRLCKP